MLPASLVAGSGCARAPAFGSLVASEGSERVLTAYARATLGRRSEDLLRLFSEECLQGCSGFRLMADQARGGLHSFRWETRSEPGSLADDLHGQLSLYERVDRARLSFVSLAFEGRRRAMARVAIAVEGRLRGGARRSDRGVLGLALVRRADDTWVIEGIDPGEVRSVFSRAPLFGRAERVFSPDGRSTPLHEGPGRAGAFGANQAVAADLGALGADRGAGLSVADLDGDGHLDVFLPGPGLGRLLRNDGKGRLLPDPPIPQAPASDRGASALFADLDQDGDPDLFVVTSKGESRWLENRNGRLVPPGPAMRPLPEPLGPGVAAALVSFHDDGRLALVFAPAPVPEAPAPALRVLGVTRAGLTAVPRGLPPGLRHTAALCAADLDGDGRTDLVHVSRLGPVALLRNTGGRFEAMAHAERGPILGRACSLADLDGDGLLDVAVAAVRSPEAWKAAQAGFPLPGGPFLGGARATALRTRLAGATQGSFWLRNEGRGRFARRPLASQASLGWDLAIAAEDLDGDGRAEVALGGGFHWVPEGRARRRPRSLDDVFFSSVLPRLLSGRPAPPLRISMGSLGATRGVTLLLPNGAAPVARSAAAVAAGELHLDVGTPAGLDLPPGVRGLAWADLDRDGLPDLLMRRSDGSLIVHRLLTPLGAGRTLTLRIGSRGARRRPNGALVAAQGLEQLAIAALDGGATDRPFGETRLGLGQAARADRVEVRWPGGAPEEWQDLNTNAAYTLQGGEKNPVEGLGTRSTPRPRGPVDVPPARKVANPGDPPAPAGPGDPPAPAGPGDPGPSPGRPAGSSLVAMGLPLGRLPELQVAPALHAAGLGPRPLRAFLGKVGTVLYLPPDFCASCRTYLASLSRVAPAWHRRGIATLVVNAPVGALQRRGAPGLLALASTRSPSSKPRLLGLLLVLDATGRPRTIYVGTQPDPALLEHRLPVR